MKLKDFYSKEVDRDIQGVIKVDSEGYQEQELSEYVVTNELNKHFINFYDAFMKSINVPTENMGVWISGFFGSGKSHFLKILSFLLENKEIKLKDGKTKKAVDFFDDKIDDAMLLANIKKVGSYNNECILFNIDTKADIGGDKDRILQVFEKVFNESQGLSNIPHIAELERYLIKQGKYEEFKDNFKKIAGESWKVLRSDYIFNRDEIIEAYSKTLGKTKEEAENWIDTAKEEYTLSVEKFANRVLEYVKTKDNNYHLIFLVDEIGQYIGDDRNLILNLQSVVEELGVLCQGKVWLAVTSQEAIDDVVNIKGEDFSKIQGRFDTRLSMSSSDIREVIEKRILDKKEDVKATLEEKYKQEGDVIKNLLYFNNASTIRLYNDEIDFTKDYPFVPYQYEMIQSVFEGIRKKGYAGKHLSSGERSLLGAFKQVAAKNGDKELGFLVPFYEFFDTIEKFLEHQIIIVFNRASNLIKENKLDEFDINVLKVLFLLKNIDFMEPNMDNIATLCIDNIKSDKSDIKQKVENSLKKLEKETLIQRTNDSYVFLTDNEQEINREIKKYIPDSNEKITFFKNNILDALYSDTKFSLNKSKPFPLKKSIDDNTFTADYNIGISFITSYSGKKLESIKIESTLHPNMLYVNIDVTGRIDQDIENILQIKKYYADKSNITKNEQVALILKAKRDDADRVEKSIRDKYIDILCASDMIIAGDIQVINGSTFKSRVDEALKKLVQNVYMKLSYVETYHNQSDIKDLFYDNEKKLIEIIPNKLVYNEIDDYVKERTTSSIQISIKDMLSRFGDAPYGWSDEEILYQIVLLMKNEKISLYFSGENLSRDDDNTFTKLTNRTYYDKTTIKTRQKVDDKLVNDLKEVARIAFNNTGLSSEEDDMVREFKNECLNKSIEDLKIIAVSYQGNELYQYPGEDTVQNALVMLNNLRNISDNILFFNEVSNKKNDILDIFDKISYIKEFFGENNKGRQKEFFDKAVRTLKIYDNNKSFLSESDDLKATYELIVSILKSENPYKDLPKLNLITNDLVVQLGKKYEEICEPTLKDIDENVAFIEKYSKDNQVDNSVKTKYISILNNAKNVLENSSECKDIFAQKQLAETTVNSFINEAKRTKENIATNSNDLEKENRKVVRIDSLVSHSVSIDKKDDIDNFINDLKSKLYKELEKNSKIIIR